MKRLSTAVLAAAAIGALLHAQAGDLGRIDFPTSGSPAAQASFIRGVLLLHSFEYDDAAEAFREAEQLQPDFAMAYWGEAMTCNHPVWLQQDRDAARAALARLAPTPEARLAKATTAREKDYLRAVEILYGDADRDSRNRAYADAMRQLAARYPDDSEAASFYALAVIGAGTPGGRNVPVYLDAAAVAGRVFAKNPNHPGAAHYLIHAYDDPGHASLGLPAAEAYGRIAPAAPHALHMPSHIFFALGMWSEAVAANQASWAAADARVQRRHLPIDERGYHALHWLEYALLQQGRYREARQQLATMEKDAAASGSVRTRMHLAVMRAGYLVEARQWAAAPFPVDLAKLDMATTAADLFARGMSAIGRGDLKGARLPLAEIERRLRESSQSAGDHGMAGYAGGSDTALSLRVVHEQLRGLLARADGRGDEAVALMKKAAATEDSMSFEFGPPVIVKPSHELLGELLLDLKRPADARAEFERALKATPKRALSLLGLARAASAAGDKTTAATAYAQLREIWKAADRDLPELREIAAANISARK